MKRIYLLHTVWVLMGGVGAVAAQPAATLPEINGVLGRSVRVAVDVGDISGQGVSAYLLTIAYNPEIVRLRQAIKSATLSADMTLAVNTQVPGRITLGGAQAEPLAGAGPLIILDFELIGVGETGLDWQELTFNEELAVSNVVNGRIRVFANAAAARLIGNWTVSEVSGRVGETVIVPVRSTDLGGEGVFSYLMTVGVDRQIGRLVGVATEATLSAGMEVATSSLEAGRLTLAASGVEPLQGEGDVIHLLVELIGQGTSAVVFRDVLLNEGDIGVQTTNGSVEARIGAPDGVGIRLPLVTGEVGQQATLVVSVDDLSAFDISSYFLVIYYEADLLRVLDVTTENTLSAAMSMEVNADIPGQIRVAAAQVNPLQGGGTLLNLQVAYVGSGTGALQWANVVWNDGLPQAAALDGEITVSGDNEPDGPQVIRTGSNEDFDASIGPASVTLLKGQQVDVEITASQVKLARNTLITARYDPAIFAFQGFVAGDLIPGIVTLPAQTEIGPKNSEITKAGGAQLGLDGTPGEGSGVLGRLRFSLIGELPPEGGFISIIELQINATSTDKDIMAFGAGTLGTQVLPFVRRPGDFNADDRVDEADFSLFSEHFDTHSTDPQWNPLFDIVQNGSVDYFDLFLLADLIEGN